jgi:hypothetical protein
MVTVSRPTILIGLGGTGCLIADRVLAKARRAGLGNLERIVVVGVDTHVRDLRRMTSVEKRFRIQTSTPETVREILTAPGNWELIKNWHLPVDHLPEDVLTKSLIEGAGQVRMLSRLALHLSLANGNARQVLTEAIARVSRLSNRAAGPGQVQIVLAGSLAGATGSGAVISIASVLDQLCRESAVTGIVRGVFLLGDIFVKTSTLARDQLVNAQFNTYAALAELNACNAYAANVGAPVGFQYEVGPGMSLKRGVPPLQTVTLIDYEDDLGGNLGHDREAYNEMGVRAVYQYVFTPIGERLDGVMINDLRATARAKELNRNPIYSGIGVYAIRYPRDDMESYLADALAAENLRGEWLALDDAYDLKNKAYEITRLSNPSEERPKVAEVFLQSFETFRKDSAFFKRLHLNLHPGSVELEAIEGEPVHLRYFDALVREVLEQFWKTTPLPDAVQQITRVNIATLEEKRDFGDILGNIENDLDRAWRAVSMLAPTLPTDIFRTVFSIGLEPEKFGGDRDYHLKKWLVSDKLHLVAVRWFLYSLRKHIEAENAKLDPKEIARNLKSLGRVFNPRKRGGGQGPSIQIDPEVMPRSNPEIFARGEEVKGTWARWTGKRRKFIDAVVRYQQNSIQLITNWAEARAKEQIYAGLLRELAGLIGLVEIMFDQVKLMRREIDDAVATKTVAHAADRGKGVFDGVRYVLAEPEDKQRIAREAMAAANKGADDNKETNAAISDLLVTEYIKSRLANPTNPSESVTKTDAVQLRRLLYDRLVEGDAHAMVKGRLRSFYDFSVWAAVQKDWNARQEIAPDAVTYLEDIVRGVRRNAQPFIDYSNPNVGQPIIFWSVNPLVLEEFGNRDQFFNIFRAEPGEDPDIDEVYPTDELICTHVRANLDLSDIRKLHPGDDSDHARGVAMGAYREKYLAEVEPLRRSITGFKRSVGRITPHVDRYWHKPGMLPEIFSQKQQQVSNQIDRSYVTAVVLKLIEKTTPSGRGPIASLDLSHLPGGSGDYLEIIASHDDWEIAKEFRRNSDYGLAIEILWDAALKSMDLNNAPLFDQNSMSQVTEGLLALAVPQVDSNEREAAARNFLGQLIELLVQVVERLSPQQSDSARRAHAHKLAEVAFDTALQDLVTQFNLAPENRKRLEVVCDNVLLAATMPS